jgi:hypothetical protein
VLKPAPRSGPGLLAFPDTYEIGIPTWGRRSCIPVLNKTAGIASSGLRSLADMEAQLRQRGCRCSRWRRLAAAGLRVLGFSRQYELTYTNVLASWTWRDPAARRRAAATTHPADLCGGPTATHPEPLAPFIDAFFLGEARRSCRRCAWSRGAERAGCPGASA